MDEIYRKALENARKELDGLMMERALLDERIAKLAKSIEGLAGLSDDPNLSSEIKAKLLDLEISEAMGVTEAIRHIINSSMMAISPTQIRDALVQEGFDTKKYSNLLTVIHNTLIRLEKQGEIQRAVNFFSGERGWQPKLQLKQKK